MSHGRGKEIGRNTYLIAGVGGGGPSGIALEAWTMREISKKGKGGKVYSPGATIPYC